MIISLLVNAHDEKLLLCPALRSAQRARDICLQAGISAETVVVADRPDTETTEVIESWRNRVSRVDYVDFGNLGLARNHGLAVGEGEYFCFLDGDDVWQPDWPLLAYRYSRDGDYQNTIYHTEVFAGFGAEHFLRSQIGTSDLLFHPNHLVAAWHFCNNLFAHKEIFQRHPIDQYDHERGFGSEDWHWSCQTCFAGIQRVTVPKTAYYYRLDSRKVSLGKTAWLALQETPLFQRDPRILDYHRHIGVRFPSASLLRDLNEIKNSNPAPDWIAASIAQSRDFEPDLWLLQEKLSSLRVETPRLYVGVAAAFSEIRRLKDDGGSIGVIFVKTSGLAPHEFARLARTLVFLSEKVPLLVGLDRSIIPDMPIYRDGNILYLHLESLFENDGFVPYSLLQLLITTLVQFRPAFVLNVMHWLGDALSNYRTLIANMGLRYVYLGKGDTPCDGISEDQYLASRIQGGVSWYSEIWLGNNSALPDYLSHFPQYANIRVISLAHTDISDVLMAAATEEQPKTKHHRIESSQYGINSARWISKLRPQVSCVLNVHKEKEILIPTLRSIGRMLDRAEEHGSSSELIIVCDSSDSDTRQIVEQFCVVEHGRLVRVLEIQEQDLGAARNIGINENSGRVCRSPRWRRYIFRQLDRRGASITRQPFELRDSGRRGAYCRPPRTEHLLRQGEPAFLASDLGYAGSAAARSVVRELLDIAYLWQGRTISPYSVRQCPSPKRFRL